MPYLYSKIFWKTPNIWLSKIKHEFKKWKKEPLFSLFHFHCLSASVFQHVFLTIYLLYSPLPPPPPRFCDLAWGKQICDVKALTTEYMDTAERDVHVWNEISAQSVGVAAIKHIKPFGFKVSSRKIAHILWSHSCNNCVSSPLSQINPFMDIQRWNKCWVSQWGVLFNGRDGNMLHPKNRMWLFSF